MKKVNVFIIVGVLLFGICSASNANAQNANNERRIIGTWIDEDGDVWAFNTDGTTTGYDNNIRKYYIIETKLVIVFGTRSIVYNYYLSSGGNTLLLELSSNTSSANPIKHRLLIKK
jgi:hypothetical protein